MKNTTLLVMLGIVLAIIGAFVFLNSGQAEGSTNVVAQGQLEGVQKGATGPTQKITLGMSNFKYNPNTITVKANQPVEMTLDSSVKGCGRSLAIMGLNVRKFSANPSEKITFTPTKKGTFTMTCSMGMVGSAKLIVE